MLNLILSVKKFFEHGNVPLQIPIQQKALFQPKDNKLRDTSIIFRTVVPNCTRSGNHQNAYILLFGRSYLLKSNDVSILQQQVTCTKKEEILRSK